MLSGIEQLTNETKGAVLIFFKKMAQRPRHLPACICCRQLKLFHSPSGKDQRPGLKAAGFGHFNRLFCLFIPFIRSFTPSGFQIGDSRYIFVSLSPAKKQPDRYQGLTYKKHKRAEKFRVGTAVVISLKEFETF
jgi:hypothetical protein